MAGSSKAVHANQFGSGGRIELIQLEPQPTPTPTPTAAVTPTPTPTVTPTPTPAGNAYANTYCYAEIYAIAKASSHTASSADAVG